ncbi:MAG: ATP-binding protein [Saprospiraceae bacterium]|nr:ATP-binding protein [Saprospiraceae bacterium]
MVARELAEKILQLAAQFRSVAVMGPRQSGKTTLAKTCFPNKPYVSFENPQNRSFALSDPLNFLSKYPDGAILDEVQRVPQILSYLQQNLDEDERRGKFVLTGSNNLLLLEQITQTLAGRVAYVDLLPFSIGEIGQIENALQDLNETIFKGGYPPIQADRIMPQDWFSAYVRTYIERDVRQIKNIENLFAFEKLLSLCAGRVGQQVNYANLSIEVGMDYKTIQSWIGILHASYIIYLLPPYFKNFNKRIVKTPKLYFYDTGLACHLLRISAPDALYQHPYRGALFENFIINELLKNRFNQGRRSNLFYWRDSTGHEVDVILDNGLDLVPIEIKSGQTITSEYFKGLDFWGQLTGNQGGTVIYGGDDQQIRSKGIQVRSWREIGKF